MRTASALGALAALSMLAACADNASLRACNVAQRACQEDVYYSVLRVRGDGWDPFAGLPPIRTIALDQYRAELEAERGPPRDDDEPTEVAPDPWGKALQLLGLITPATSAAQASVESQVNNVAAFYSPGTGKVTVIDRGQLRDDVADTILLAHELVHAFQDRELGSRLFYADTDGGFASRAFVEGEAVLYERLIAQEVRQRPLSRSDWQHYYGSWLTGLRMTMPEQRSPFFAAPWFVYPLGGAMLTQRWLDGGNAAVRSLAAASPEHSFQYMAAATEPALMDERLRASGCAFPPRYETFDRIGHDRFGAIQFYAFLTRAGLDEASAWRLALGWRNDHLGVYFDRESERTFVEWRVSFADDAVARDAAEQIEAAPKSTVAKWLLRVLQGGELAISASDRAEGLPEGDAALACR